jgi:hypothetical protein
MAISELSNFGRCSCGGQIRLTWVEVRFPQPGTTEPTLIGNVPQGGCQACGSRYYKTSTLQWIERAFLVANR